MILNDTNRPYQERLPRDSYRFKQEPDMNSNGPRTPRIRQYRSRRQRPCDNCRRRRVCCLRNENEPCSLCQSRSLDCTFLSLPNPKIRRSSSTSVAAARKQASGDSVLVHTNDTPSRPSPTQIQPEECPSMVEKEVPVEKSKEDENPAISPAETLQFVGLSGDQDPFILQYCRTKRIRDVDGIQWTCHRFGNDPRFPASFTAVPDQHLDAHPSYYPLTRRLEIASPYTDQLIRSFFEVVHPSVPILDPQSFSPSTAFLPLLASVFALAHPYCHGAQAINPWLFMDFNSQALPIEARNAKLETVEAALLHAQRHTYIFRAPTMPGLWAEVGTIVGMSQDVGLNIDASDWDIPEGEKKRRKRLWWAVYMQDKWAALTLGRPSYIHDDQYDVEDLEVADVIPDQNVSEDLRDLPARVFVAAARLTVILSDILSQLYTVKGVKRLYALATGECYNIAHGFIGRLDGWKEEYLTPLLLYDTIHDPTGSLQLAYYTVEITLCRAILRTPAGVEFRQRSASLVSSVIDWLKNLQVNRVSAFWWSASKINFAIAGGFMIGMFLSATKDEEVNYWIKEITTYRNLLRAHSPNFNVTKLASIRMDLLLQRDISDNTSVNDEDEVDSSATQRPSGLGQGLGDQDQQGIKDSGMDAGNLFSTETLREDFAVEPAVAFGNTYGLEWDANLDQLLSGFDYRF